MTHNYRHGDLCLIGITELPKGLTASENNVLLANGSGGHNHSFKGGIFYPKIEGENIIGYFQAENTSLFHPEHGEIESNSTKESPIENGAYEVRKQNEITHEGLREVID